ncbi:MAG TPA: helix-turn-helix transcriptional regulator [Candidatus Mediterraneibacter quadrami]|uniref:Helix-turn-helix transcriptional regulator n=1 Tax=Candidatus Mediterraneibacter quadrami TaxID=2838684 RepID=A0A9D2U5X7_9FIRM|nr:helix-turn-helix transcriptional regulator [Candidatus Mediterraneibacter quadrami]
MSDYTEKKTLPACPVETTLTLIGDKWKVLTAQLRDMERDGLVSRKVYPEVPPKVEYALTELGMSLKPILDALWNWGEDYKSKVSSDEENRP